VLRGQRRGEERRGEERREREREREKTRRGKMHAREENLARWNNSGDRFFNKIE